jgi:metal-responsive CopG/Arc/MetJ family transcriptional regulator
MPLTSIRLPDHLARDLDEIASRRRTTRSELVREAVEEYCAGQRTREDADPVALVERLVTYRGSGKGDLAARSEEYLREIFRDRRRRRSR